MIKMKRFILRRTLKPLGFNLDYYSPRPMIRFLKASRKKDLVGAEIGVRDGWNALDILENLSIKKLYLIDPYMAYADYKESQDMHNYQKWIDEKKKVAKKALRKYKNKIVWINDFSDKAISRIKEDLDFVYIDGNHQYGFVKKDIELYYPKVKKGGIIGGDDYYLCDESKASNFGVVEAVNKFFKIKNINFMHRDWWVIKK